MKTLRNGLVAAALASSISGCFYIIKEEPDCGDLSYEQIELNNLFVDNGDYTEAVATLDHNGYRIVCDDGHYYSFSRSKGELRWSGWSYFDNNNDKIVDRVEFRGPITVINENTDFYNNKRNELRDDYIFRMWELRWRNR